MIFFILLLAIISALAVLTALENERNKKIPTISANPQRPFYIHIHSFLGALDKDAPFDVSLLGDTFRFINDRYDCADFLANSVLRALYAYGEKLDNYKSGLKAQMSDVLLDFKYHWDQNGYDSLCTWSENHQILFAGLEYLAGAMFTDEVFSNSGRRGAYHKERGKQRVLNWCRRRFKYGFSEWYSNNYYLEDIAAMSNIQEFAPDEEVRNTMTRIMHLLMMDMATQSLNGSFVSTSGRMYENNKKSARTGCAMNRIISYAFDIPLKLANEPFKKDSTSMTKDMDLNFLLNKSYKLPEIIKYIAQDTSSNIIKASGGIDVAEGKARRFFGTDDAQIALQWETEAFTNHQVFKFSMNALARNKMLCSEFFAPLKRLNLTVLKPFYRIISMFLNPFTNGKATQRVNTYTFRTPNYLMATAQNYHPGGFGDQQHIWNCLLSDNACIFATHPSGELPEEPAGIPAAKGVLSNSPGYWVGNGRNPHAMQCENIILSIYHIPDEKAAFESQLHQFTHAYFPFKEFYQTYTLPNMVFGQIGDTYVALIGASQLERYGKDELRQYGKKQFWICECSARLSSVPLRDVDAYQTDDSFDAFIKRIKSIPLSFDGQHLSYGNLSMFYKGNFLANGKRQPFRHKRFDNKYCLAGREANSFVFKFKGERLEISLTQEQSGI